VNLLTLTVFIDGSMCAVGNANRVHDTNRHGTFVKEFALAPAPGQHGPRTAFTCRLAGHRFVPTP
jgi:hypothetical protein